ncbi:11893_t:CDS:2, partial [Ambispora leptoticha]
EKLNKEQARKLKTQTKHYLVREGILYQKNGSDPERPLRVLQKEQVPIMLQAMHNDPVAGHLSKERGKPKAREALHPIKVTQPFNRIEIIHATEI